MAISLNVEANFNEAEKLNIIRNILKDLSSFSDFEDLLLLLDSEPDESKFSPYTADQKMQLLSDFINGI